MKRLLIWASNQANLDAVQTLLTNGYELDPEYAKPIHMELALVYPLVLYESDYERAVADEAKEKAERKPSELEDVDSIVSVDINLADEKLRDGYRVLEAFAKTVTLVKRRKPVPILLDHDEGTSAIESTKIGVV